jgi:hypothetical protein
VWRFRLGVTRRIIRTVVCDSTIEVLVLIVGRGHLTRSTSEHLWQCHEQARPSQSCSGFWTLSHWTTIISSRYYSPFCSPPCAFLPYLSFCSTNSSCSRRCPHLQSCIQQTWTRCELPSSLVSSEELAGFYPRADTRPTALRDRYDVPWHVSMNLLQINPDGRSQPVVLGLPYAWKSHLGGTESCSL